jgi:HSP20 family protein
MGQDLVHFMRSLFTPVAERFREGPWRPSVDVYRTRTGWLLKFDLAGVRAEEVSVRLGGRCLTVRGCRRDWFAEEGHHHYLMEIAYSSFERSVELPADLEPSQVTTEYQDGLLLVRIQTETPT